MSGEDAARSAEIAAAVLAYLGRHPRARDTARGIGSRWLGTEAPGAPPALVDAALEQLANEGKIRRIPLPDGGVLYGSTGN